MDGEDKYKNLIFISKAIHRLILEPDGSKISCTVWDGGKSGDNIEVLPIVIIESDCFFRNGLALFGAPRMAINLVVKVHYGGL